MSEKETNGRCYKERAADGPSLLQNGNLVFQAHHVGWIIASFFTIVASVVSFWLIGKHLKWYTNKREQRYIVRILLMVPIYAVISLLSYFFWNQSTPLILLRDCYESTVLTSFFYLLLMYISPDADHQRLVFSREGISREADREAIRKGVKQKRWMLPFGFVKTKPETGLYFLQLMKWGILQYCVLRPLTTLAAVILDYLGLYCETSFGLGWGHVYIILTVSISVSVAMYCLIQLYLCVSVPLKPQKPLLKLFAIKAVVFLTFWQATFLSVLSLFGVVNDTKYMTAEDINIGIGALLETFEMMLFALLHVRAFSYKPYRPIRKPNSKEPEPTPASRLRSLGHAMDFRETFRELWGGWLYMWARTRGRVPAADQGTLRLSHYERAFGKSRPSIVSDARHTERSNNMSPQRPTIQVEKRVDTDHHRMWLGSGNNYGYGFLREKSEDLSLQIDRELEKRGYGSDIHKREHIKAISRENGFGHKPQRSWWRSIYNRLSQTEQDGDEHRPENSTPMRRPSRVKKSRSRSHRSPDVREIDVEDGLLFEYDYEMNDPPPPSLIRQNAPLSPSVRPKYDGVPIHDDDMLSPLTVFNEHRSSHHRKSRAHRGDRDSRKQRSGSSSKRQSHGRRKDSSPSALLYPHAPATLGGDPVLSRMFPGGSSDLQHTAEKSFTAGSSPTLQPSANVASSTSLANGYVVGMGGERCSRPEIVQPSIGQSMCGEIIDATSTTNLVPTTEHQPNQLSVHSLPSPDPETTSNQVVLPLIEHSVDTYLSRSPPRDLITSHPSGTLVGDEDPPKLAPVDSHHARHPLRRTSAQVYSQSDYPSRRKRNSLDPTVLPHAFRTPVSHHSSRNRAHRTSRPLSIPLPLARESYIPEAPQPFTPSNLASTIAQPSHSGTTEVLKYPDQSICLGPRYGYPGLPPATSVLSETLLPSTHTHTQYSYQRHTQAPPTSLWHSLPHHQSAQYDS